MALVGLIIYELATKSRLSWHASGIKFFFRSEWDPVNEQFGALPFVFGTIVSSILALLLAVPLAVGVAVFITEMCPRWLRGALAFTTELLAAIPSIIYGLWAMFVLVPLLREHVEPWLARYFGWTSALTHKLGFQGPFEGPPYGIGMLAAAIILAIMVIPIVSSITREVMTAVPQQQREAVLALGSDSLGNDSHRSSAQCESWYSRRCNSRLGPCSGRNHGCHHGDRQSPRDCRSLFAPGYTMASVIANEFTEATGDIYLSALVEVGLALFIVTDHREHSGAIAGLDGYSRHPGEGQWLRLLRSDFVLCSG